MGDTIAHITESGLCTGCGTCAGVCPNEAIKMRRSDFKGLYLPEIEEQKCNRCGLCLKSCPGYSVDLEGLNLKIFGNQPADGLLGNYLACYVGHSNDRDIRYNSSSGGIVAQMLIFALEKGIIDGALVVRMKKDNPLESEWFIARTKREITASSGSKYCPVAVNEGIKEILKEEGKFAVVGLPCHIHGVRKAEGLFKAFEKRILLHIGLMCSHTVNFAGTEFLLEKMGIKKSQVTELSYRGRGWPGSMSVQVKGCSNLTLPYVGGWNAYWPVFSSFFFTPMRCIMCPDQTNELADISLGDAWIPESKHEKTGRSIIITRTQTAERTLNIMSSIKMVSLKRVDSEKVKQSQAQPLKFKKVDISSRLLLLRALGKETPKFTTEPVSTKSPVVLLRTLFSYVNIQASSNKYLRSWLVHVPFPLFRLYYGLFKLLSSI